MTRPLSSAELDRANGPIWLLEVEWNGRAYRWASELPPGESWPLVLTDSDGVAYAYEGATDVSWEDPFLLFAESPAAPTLSRLLYFPQEVNVAEQVANGADLSTMTARLYRWPVGGSYEDRRPVFYGQARQPNYGGPSEPVGVTFEAPIYRDGASWPEGRLEAGHIGVDSDLSTGAEYPIVFGAPRWLGETTETSLSAGAPAYPFDRTSKKLLAGYLYGATFSKLWSVSRDAQETASSAQEFDSKGRRVTVITSTDVNFDAGDEYAVAYGGTEYGGGQLAELCARFSSHRVDHSKMRLAAGLLDEFRFSGFIDASVKPFDWFTRTILPLLPASSYFTAEGLALRVWNDRATLDDIVANVSTTVDGGSLVRVSPVQIESGELVNECTVLYSPDQTGKSRKSVTVTGRPDLGDAPEVIVSPYALASRLRLAEVDAAGALQGVRAKVIETPFVYEQATATRIASWIVRARCRPRRVIRYLDTEGRLEAFEPGSHVALTDAELSISGKLAMIRSKIWRGRDFLVDLVLIDDLLNG